MTTTPFSQAIRERTWTDHGQSEGAGFMHDLMTGRGTREDYIELVAQHYFVYRSLERAADRFAVDPVASAFVTPALTRMPSLERDLEFLLGSDWRDEIAPVPTAERYAERIDAVADSGWAGGFVAHHYTRYLGDLSGGQAISRIMQRTFGFDRQGVEFYHFDAIPSGPTFKNEYRGHLDAAAWDADERERIIDEVVLAYRLNTELFEDMSAAKAAA
jgi:heme oxygenase